MLVLGAGCAAEPDQIGIPELTPPRDAAAAPIPIPDGAVLCDSDDECRDDIDCTSDRCVVGGYCINVSDNSRCSDGIFCNGQEVCDPLEGCRESVAPDCNDANACTQDLCDEESKSCEHTPRDFDDDGEIDWHCFDGTDCDDFDATRGKGASEICNDGIDNDCDGTVDEALDCGRPRHDTCDDALEVSAGGAFVAELSGSTPDYALSCGGVGVRDVTFTFTTEKAQDVTLIARGLLGDGSDEVAVLGVRSDCGDVASEFECTRGFPGELRMRALPAGRYYVIVTSEMAQRVVLSARFDEATPAPTNTSCQNPLDISEGGRFESDLVDVGDDERVQCTVSDSNDLIYVFTTQEERDVEISALSDTGDPMYVSVRSTCDDTTTGLRCLASNAANGLTFGPARGRLHRLPVGTYYLVVEGPSSREVEFSLDVAFLEPTDPPPGDGCGVPEPLELDSMLVGSLANRQDLVNVQCGCDPDDQLETCGLFFNDFVYRFQIDEATDLRVDIDGGQSNVGYDLRSVCESAASQVSCHRAGNVDDRIRNLQPGEYYLIVESSDSANFALTTEFLPLTVPVEVSDNLICEAAFEIPPTGGLFTGSTVGARNDYEATCGAGAQSDDAAYRLELSAPARVVASLQAGFDTVLYRFGDDGDGPASCVSEAESACNDDGGGNTNSQLDETLEAGVYYYIVDGFRTNSRGAYTFEVEVTDP